MFDDELPDYLKVPEALKIHPELIKRNVIPDYSLNTGSVYGTNAFKAPHLVVKVLNPSNEEEAIIHRLQHDTSARNHPIPCEIIQSDPVLLVMPSVQGIDEPIRMAKGYFQKLCALLKVFHQIAEGVDHLHNLRIAHIDLCFGNVLAAVDDTEKEHPQTKAGRVYIIDFDRSRQLEWGPGHQLPIELPSTQYEPSWKMTYFDPYAWDVYCMGKLFQNLTKDVYCHSSSPPWLAGKLSQWVKGDERGCAGVCHCRPTARRVLLVFTVIGWAVSVAEVFVKAASLPCVAMARRR